MATFDATGADEHLYPAGAPYFGTVRPYPTAVSALAVSAFAPLIGKQDIARLVVTSPTMVRRWRQASTKALDAGVHTAAHLPAPDRVVRQHPLWYPLTIANWALSNRHPLRAANLILPPVTEIWSQQDIADFFGISIDIARATWHHHDARTQTGDEAPGKTGPVQDFTIDGMPFWLPGTVKNWSQDKKHATCLSGERQQLTDAVQEGIERGELWDRAGIAAFFGVTTHRVSLWRSSDTNFPQPSGLTTRTGRETWWPSDLIVWGKSEDGGRRIVNGVVIQIRGKRNRFKGRTRKTNPGTATLPR